MTGSGVPPYISGQETPMGQNSALLTSKMFSRHHF